MNRERMLSNVSKEYLSEYYEILDRMIERMNNVELRNSISYNYVAHMIPHCNAAIEMSKNILRFTTFLPLQNIADKIICDNRRDIESMKKVVPKCLEFLNVESDISIYQHRTAKIIRCMAQGMERACAGNRINIDYIKEMIPHRRVAVKISKNALDYDLCPELKCLIEEILFTHEEGITRMEHMLRSVGC